MRDTAEQKAENKQEVSQEATPKVQPMGQRGISSMQGNPENTLNAQKTIKLNESSKEAKFGELEPNARYVKNGYTYDTDSLGRTKLAGGSLNLKDGERSPEQTRVGHLGKKHDEGGHLVGSRFDGPKDGFNLIPQDQNLNRGEYKKLENSWAEAKQQGKAVDVVIEPHYKGNSSRPDSIEVLSQIEGEKPVMKVFRNEPQHNR